MNEMNFMCHETESKKCMQTLQPKYEMKTESSNDGTPSSIRVSQKKKPRDLKISEVMKQSCVSLH